MPTPFSSVFCASWLSAAWGRLAKLLEDPVWRQVRLDQCALNLRSAAGGLHLKPTRIATTSEDIACALDLRCSGDHLHDLVEGKAVTKRSETYSQEMAELVASGGKVPELIAPFALERFSRFRQVNEMGATAASH